MLKRGPDWLTKSEVTLPNCEIKVKDNSEGNSRLVYYHLVQQEEFNEDIKRLSKNEEIAARSRIKKLSPELRGGGDSRLSRVE